MGTAENEKTIASLLEENQRLHETIEELSVLNDISAAISSSMSLEEIETVLIKKCIKYLMVEEGVVTLLNDTDSEQPVQTLLRKPNSIFESLPNKIDDQVIGWVLKNKTTLMVNNFSEDTRFKFGDVNDTRLKSLLCAPMFVKGKLIGFVSLINKRIGEFTLNEQRLLSICASQSAQIIENARLYKQESVLIKLIEEMSLAAQIQKNLLPKAPFIFSGYTILGATFPAKDVGGDFYDYISLTKNKAAIWLGDVSGKGIPASLLMATIQGVLRSKSLDSKSCSDTLQFLNEIILRNNDEDKYATLFYSILNFETNELTFVSAAHERIFHFHKNQEYSIIKSEDIPVGILPTNKFKECALKFESGDFVFVFSDGIIDAENCDEIPFGWNRLLNLVKDNSKLKPDELIQKIFDEINTYSVNALQTDDQTLLIIKLD